MKPEAQRVAIAEAIGWTNVHTELEPVLQFEQLVGLPPKQKVVEILVPNFPLDLNAMHEAEEVIAASTKPYSSNPMDHEPMRYLAELRKVVGARIRPEVVISGLKKADGSSLILTTHVYASGDEELKVIRATAAQRAEAFLRTLNLWTEDETT